MNDYSHADDCFAEGWEEGRRIGFEEGCIEASQVYESRFSAFWAELQTLNARVAYLERFIKEKGI